MRYLFGYDGSGVPMSAAIEGLEIAQAGTVAAEHLGTMARVRFTEYTPPLDSLAEVEATDDTRWVRLSNVHAAGEHLDLASFNFLD